MPSAWTAPAAPAAPADGDKDKANMKSKVTLLDVMAQQFVQREEEQTGREHEDQLARLLQEQQGEPVSDEELARRLQAQFDDEAHRPAEDPDHLLAQRLQADYDRAFNQNLTARERRVNGLSKVTVSFERYRRPVPEDELVEEDVSDEESQETVTAPHKPDTKGKRVATTTPPPKPAPSSPKKKEIVTKHDIPTNNKRNARRLETLPLSFNSGNTSDLPDLGISNRVFNQMREHSRKAQHSDERSKAKIFGKEDVATNDRVLDPRTRLMLFSMMSSGVLPELMGVISCGKEANVYAGVFSPQAYAEQKANNGRFHAMEDGDEDEDDKEKEGEAEEELVDAAIKVFRTSLNEFKQREMYVRDDFRFNLRMNRSNPRKFITLWAEKEMHNLFRLQCAGIRSPKVLLYRKHILVMQLIGKKGRPAPKLCEIVNQFSASKVASLYRECLRMMRSMYQEAHLVHADLSAYNILYHNGKLWFIDVSQAVIRSHVHAHEFLLRDCQSMATFFASHGVPDALTPLEMLAYVTFHPGRFARRVATEEEDEEIVDVADDGDDEWSDVESASVASGDGTWRRQRAQDTLDFAKEDEFLDQVKRDVAALAAAHPVGVDPIKNAGELLSYLLPAIHRVKPGDSEEDVNFDLAFPSGNLNTATYRSAPADDKRISR